MKKLMIGIAVVALAAAPAQANEIDLTTAGATGQLIGLTGGTALVYQGAQLSGTGVFPAFVQVAGGGSVAIHDAYNTTVNGVLFNGASDQFNHEITVADLGTTLRDDTLYYEFFLDINESKNDDRWLSLDDIRVYTSTAANQSSTPFPSGTLQWDMNPADVILLDYSLEPGSGRADMGFLVPVASFAGALQTDYVYLYSQFGSLGLVGDRNYGHSAGFEEWANSLTKVQPVPDGGATALLLGLSMFGLGVVRRFRR